MAENEGTQSGHVVQSPCVRQCRLIDGVCAGCDRTLEEIQFWSEMTDAQREAVMRRLRCE